MANFDDAVRMPRTWLWLQQGPFLNMGLVTNIPTAEARFMVRIATRLLLKGPWRLGSMLTDYHYGNRVKACCTSAMSSRLPSWDIDFNFDFECPTLLFALCHFSLSRRTSIPRGRNTRNSRNGN